MKALLFIVSGFFSLTVLASETITEADTDVSDTKVSGNSTTARYSELRPLFVKAERQIGSAKKAEVSALLEQLQDYPLQPYLQLRWLSRNLNATDDIVGFLTQYQGSPLDWPLRKPWLVHLAKRKQGELFLSHYPGSSDTELECYALLFRLQDESPQTDTIWPQVQALWTVGKSQPKVCDPLFARWREAGQLTADIVWRRLQLSAEGGDASLISYLKTLLPESEQYLADLYLKTRRNPAEISKNNFFPGKQVKERDILAYGLKRLIWRSPAQALRVWQRSVKDPYFTAAQRLDVQRQFAIALASKGDDKAEEWLGSLPAELVDNNLAQWRVGHALKQLDWPAVQHIIESFPPEIANDTSWRYWLARAYDEQGHTETAALLFRQLAERRHFYGFMAAAKLGLPPSLAHNPVPVSDEELRLLQQNPVVIRAQEWLALGRLTEARREWNYLQNGTTEQQKLISARLAHDIQWHERAIFSLADAGYWDDIELRFPLAFQDEIRHFSEKAKINSGWAMAIARRESSFMADANSPVGARGLMQIMPDTANYIAKKPVQLRQLYNPVVNIDYGTDYLNYLMRRNDGNLLMATAAYNAGYSRVRQWIPKDYAIPADVWIETIPYRETREYVKAVMAYYQIYNIRMNIAQDVFEPLLGMQIGVIAE
ncbi:transglycosylase SLT domain-containing protein [Chromatiaceae bacterium AAb-1]|nr:transglycosylase SLT domain-containing protein [Chromatiaceae bacterium AAb-1]